MCVPAEIWPSSFSSSFFKNLCYLCVLGLGCSMQAPEHVGSSVVAWTQLTPTACGILGFPGQGPSSILCLQKEEFLTIWATRNVPHIKFLRETRCLFWSLSLFRILLCGSVMSHVNSSWLHGLLSACGETNIRLKGNYWNTVFLS